MVAFSCCIYDGGDQEKADMVAARERGWKGKFTKPGRVIRPGAIRINGKCPLTPLEVISIAIVPLHLMMHKLGLIFVLTSRNPLNVSLSMHCVCHGSNKKKKNHRFICLLFYHHLLISGDNLYGSNVDNFL
jgi:hypothetical protein